jgi:septal ring factor EnvC (AmiA/AmiB activator)
MFENIKALIESAEGLDIHVTIGKECQLVVKGNFMEVARIASNMAELDRVERSTGGSKNRIAELEARIKGISQQNNDLEKQINDLIKARGQTS